MALYPSSGNHSVQNAAFAIEWLPELNSTELNAVMGAHAELIQSLPQMVSTPMMTFQMISGGPSQMVPSGVGSVSFLRTGSAGAVSRSIEVDRVRCVAQVNDYTRWVAVWPEVRKWFAAVIPKIGRRNITSIGIQFNDVFHWRDKPENFQSSAVFAEPPTLLPAAALSSKGTWHSHNGYFVEINSPIQAQLLENVNVNVVDNIGQRSIIISTVHKVTVSYWDWAEINPVLDDLMETLHKRNKNTLLDVLSEAAAESIGLKRG
jgi:uncharacterized protein (TIGR04255 family)